LNQSGGLAVIQGKVSANAEPVMCDKCQELDQKIVRYRQIMERILDDQFAAGVTKLIEEAEVEKAALHTEQQK
jgi:hypothetical protein